MSVRVCGLVPTFENPRTIRAVVERLLAHLPDVVVVDDGSGPGRGRPWPRWPATGWPTSAAGSGTAAREPR